MSTEVEKDSSKTEMLALSDIEIWDDHYDNPKAEIILVSNDGMGFRVDAWQFKKESAFIRDLLTFPSDESPKTSPIQLDHESKIVRYFIDFVMAHSTSTTQISMAEFEQLFELSDKFMAEKVEKTLMVAMRLRVQQRPTPFDLEPWTVFKFAANRNNVKLAGASIRAFENAGTHHSDIYQAPIAKFEGIDGSYIARLFVFGYKIRYNHGYDGSPFIQTRSWEEVADHFGGDQL